MAAWIGAPGCTDPDVPGQDKTPTLTRSAPLADGGTVALPDSVVQRLVAEDPLWAKALRLHYDAVVVDAHVDTPMRLLDDGYALAERHAPRPDRAHLDGPRLREGGLDAPFFSVYVARSYGEDSAAVDARPDAARRGAAPGRSPPQRRERAHRR